MLKAFKAKALKDNTFTCKLANSPGPETPTTPANPEDSLLQIAARDLCSPEINEALAPAAAAAQDEPGDDLLLQGDDQPPALLPAALRWRIKHKSKEATTSTADRWAYNWSSLSACVAVQYVHSNSLEAGRGRAPGQHGCRLMHYSQGNLLAHHALHLLVEWSLHAVALGNVLVYSVLPSDTPHCHCRQLAHTAFF